MIIYLITRFIGWLYGTTEPISDWVLTPGPLPLRLDCMERNPKSGVVYDADETPQQAPQGVYDYPLAIQGGAPQNGNGGIRTRSAARHLTREYPSRSAARRVLRTAAFIVKNQQEAKP